MTHPLQPLDSTQAFKTMQSSHLIRHGMNRKTGIMPTVFKSEEETQPLCQKEERFTVQNKLTDGSPIWEQPRNARLSMRHKRLCAMKNGQVCKTRNQQERFKRPWNFMDNERLSWTDPVKATPKARVFNQHKHLYPIKNGQGYKTRKRPEAKKTLGHSSGANPHFVKRSNNGGVQSTHRNCQQISWYYLKNVKPSPKQMISKEMGGEGFEPPTSCV